MIESRENKLNLFQKLIHYFLSESVPMVAKQYDLVILYLVPTSFVFSLLLLFEGHDYFMAVFILIMTVTLVIIWFLAHKYYVIRKACFLTCTVLNFLVIPLCFFGQGGIYGGIPLMFIEGIIITCFLMEGRGLIWMLTLQLLWYVWIVIFAFMNPGVVVPLQNKTQMFFNVAYSFLGSSMVTVFAISYQSWIHNNTSHNIEKSKSEVENARQTKSKFLANMTHEIRTPMNAIVGMTELILKEDLSRGAREETEIIKEASSELLTIINNILTYSKLDSGKLELLPTKYRFDELMNEIIQTISIELQDKSVDFHVDIDPSIPIMLYGDDIRIKQVFLSLLFNSLRYSDDGRIIMEIKNEYLNHDNSVKLHCLVADTGVGLSKVDIDAIFGAYERYDSRQGSNMKGMGLELSICRELLHLMGGELNISSIEGIGMAIEFEFTNAIVDDIPIVRLKEDNKRHVLIYLSNRVQEKSWKILNDNFNIRPEYATSHNAFSNKIVEKKYSHIFLSDHEYPNLKEILEQYDCESYTYIITDYKHAYKDFNNCKLLRRPISCLNLGDVFNDKWVQENYQAPVEKQNVIFPKARILVVDDNKVNLKIASGILENFGIKADTSSNGHECIDMLKREQYHMVLLDQFMPDMNGVETLHVIRNIPGDYYKQLPILCMTADFGGEVRERLISEGFQDYIAKPIKIYYLERFLRKYLPEELMETVTKTEEQIKSGQQTASESKLSKEQEISMSLQPDIGIVNVGGSPETYMAILNTYYREGIEKIKEIPEIYQSGDISLFTTNVHSVKGSSASVGAPGISAAFKALEMAGKSNNTDFINGHLKSSLEQFQVLLEEVKVYLYENNAFENADMEFEKVYEGEEEKLKVEDVISLKEALDQINLKQCEELLQELSDQNYGKEYNLKIAAIKTSYEMFDYHKVKGLLQEMLDELNQ